MPMPADHLTANLVRRTEGTMFIQTGKALYTGRREIPGKPVKADPGRKVMCPQPDRLMSTGAAGVQRLPLPEKKRQPQRRPQRAEALPPEAALQAILHRVGHTTGAGQAQGGEN
jgi:hypothetical protein